MARINTKLSLQVPEEINVPLVRADKLETSDTFRYFFEIFLAITSSLVGVILSIEKTSTLHWAFLSVTGVSAILFLVISIRHRSSEGAQ